MGPELTAKEHIEEIATGLDLLEVLPPFDGLGEPVPDPLELLPRHHCLVEVLGDALPRRIWPMESG